MYDSEMEIKKALEHFDKLQDSLQELYDRLSRAVINSCHASNVECLETLSIECCLMQNTAQNALIAIKAQIDDVLSAEKQFLEEDEQ